MTPYALALVFSLLVLVLIFLRLRNSRMNERYATWWIVIAVFLLVIGIFPRLLSRAAHLFQIAVPLNLAFFLAGILVLLLSLQFSVDLSKAAEQRRRLAEEVALLRQRLDTLEAREAGGQDTPDTDPGTGHQRPPR